MLYLVIVAAIVVVAVGMYNSLVKLRERADGAWADVDVQLKRRYDLIPNLVETDRTCTMTFWEPASPWP